MPDTAVVVHVLELPPATSASLFFLALLILISASILSFGTRSP